VKILVEEACASLARFARRDVPLREFFLDRVRHYFREIREFKYDEVNAVVASGWDDLVDVESRLLAIQAVRPTQDFEPLAASFKRIRNILKQAQFAEGGEIQKLSKQGPRGPCSMRSERGSRVQARRPELRGQMEAIAGMRPAVDLFFDKVLVNAPDEKPATAHTAQPTVDGVLGNRRFFGNRNTRHSN
jgi:glycyl-tRNA synthetase beta chain